MAKTERPNHTAHRQHVSPTCLVSDDGDVFELPLTEPSDHWRLFFFVEISPWRLTPGFSAPFGPCADDQNVVPRAEWLVRGVLNAWADPSPLTGARCSVVPTPNLGPSNRPMGLSHRPRRPQRRGAFRRPAKPVATVEADVLAYVAERLNAGEALPSQTAIVERFRLPKQTVSRWMAKWETAGLISRTRDGRRNVIRKVATRLRLS